MSAVPRHEKPTPSPEDDSTFDAYYSRVFEVDTEAGKVKYNALAPEGWKANRPVIAIGGWGINLGGMRDLGRSLYDNQRASLMVDFTDSKSTSPYGVYDRSRSLVEVLDDARVPQVDVVAQSEGALFASLAAYTDPDRFKNLVLACPAGLIGSDSVLKLAQRFAPNVARSLSKDMVDNPAIATRINLGVTSMTTKKPVESFKRVQDLAGFSIDGWLALVRQKGVGVGVIQANRDSVFPPQRLENNVRPMDKFANADSYASFINKQAGHQELMINSENAGLAVIQMLDNLAETNSTS